MGVLSNVNVFVPECIRISDILESITESKLRSAQRWSCHFMLQRLDLKIDSSYFRCPVHWTRALLVVFFSQLHLTGVNNEMGINILKWCYSSR